MTADRNANRCNRTRRVRLVACLLVICTALVVFHRPLLRGVARVLVVDQSPAQVDAVVIFGGENRYPVAAMMLEGEIAKNILLIESRPSRLTELGIMNKPSEEARDKLTELGVPQDKISIVQGDNTGEWRGIHILKQWLLQHPEASAAIICDRFGTRCVGYTLDQVLDESDRRRVQIVALRDRRYDESNWWLKRTGWKVVFNAYFDLGYAVLVGEDESQEPVLDPDEFEQQVVQRWNAERE